MRAVKQARADMDGNTRENHGAACVADRTTREEQVLCDARTTAGRGHASQQSTEEKAVHTQKAREETGAAQQKQIAEGQAPRRAAAQIQHSEHYHVNKNPIVNSDRSLSYRGFSDDERKLGVTWKQKMDGGKRSDHYCCLIAD